MKRDMDLIRAILFAYESGNYDALSEHEEPKLVFHTALAIEAGLLKGIVEYCNGEDYPAFASGQHITWKGYDFIDNARSETVWNRVRERVSKGVESVSFNMLNSMLANAANEILSS